VHKLQHSKTRVYFVGAGKSVRRTLLAAGLTKPLVRYAATAEDALTHWRSASANQDADPLLE
jgi:SulP family sulfate permease